MEYENPEIKENVNVSDEHPLKEFAQLVMGVVVITLIALAVLRFSAGYLVRFVPFSYEQEMLDGVLDSDSTDSWFSSEPSEQQAYLQSLADRLTPYMNLPEGMTVTVHYVDDDMVNAMATLGGNVVFFRGLIERLDSEEALAAVMAHEIAHIKYRHPIVALGEGLTAIAVIATVSGVSGSSAGASLISSSTQLTFLKFSRDQERQADDSAVRALNSLYGNVRGARELFSFFDTYEDQCGVGIPGFFRSHPYSDDRARRVLESASSNGWKLDTNLTPLAFPFPQRDANSSADNDNESEC